MSVERDAFEALGLLSDSALEELLERAEGEERSLSRRRRFMQAQLDTLNTEIDDLNNRVELAFDSLSALTEEERALSRVRLQLHQRITQLRLERSRRLDQPRRTTLRAVT